MTASPQASPKIADNTPSSLLFRPRGQKTSTLAALQNADVPEDILTTAQPTITRSRSRNPSFSYTRPSGWWTTRDSNRPWTDHHPPQRKYTVPPEQEDRWQHTRQRVSIALRSVLGNTLDVTHELLSIGADTLKYAPIPGLQEAAHILLEIWDSLQLVETNRLACLRLTERCAEILFSVREELLEAGDEVGEELNIPIMKLTESFKRVELFLHQQVHRPFLKRYLRRGEILQGIGICDTELSYALGLFSVSVQIRTLKQLQAAEARRQADTEKILAALVPGPPASPDTTPRQPTSALPPVSPPPPEPTPPPAYGVPSVTPPTPSNIPAKPKPKRRVTAAEVQSDIHTIVEKQNALDDALDLHDLRQLMRTALATSNDADMLRVLQVQRDEMPEALKTLQRALDGLEAASASASAKSTDNESEAVLVDGKDIAGVEVKVLDGRIERIVEGEEAEGVERRGSVTSSKSSRGTSRSLGLTEADPLDREFIEGGIDALRRLSAGRELSLPSWTITRYEVDLEERIGMGFFSDVYRGTWRGKTVAIKVLAPSVQQSLFVHEISIWKTFSHPNVLPLLGASSARGDPPWFFVSPYMKNGTVVSYLRSLKVEDGATGGGEDEWDPLRMVHDIAKGMEYLHGMKVLHGDLKGSNVLIDDNKRCVLADFGQSEMKSEAYRVSGVHPPHGTLRWQAPELIDGVHSGRLTFKADVYAFAVVCVEVLNKGSLPWPMMDDDTVRQHVIQNDMRPAIPMAAVPNGLALVIQRCWVRDPKARPAFPEITRDISRLRGKRGPSPVPPKFKDVWGDQHERRSPDMKPIAIPPMERSLSDSEVHHHNAPQGQDRGRIHADTIPIQRIITPESEASSPTRTHGSPDTVNSHLPPDTESPTTSSSRTTSRSSTGDSHVATGLELVRNRDLSPPPMDELSSQRKNEARYRLCMQHEFHPSLTLPVWEPSPVALGAVGYLSKPEGSFYTLFNAFDPAKSSGGWTGGLPSLYGYGKVTSGSQRQDKRSAAQRGLDAIYGLLTFKSANDGLFSRSVSRRYSFPLLAGHKSAYLCTETTRYRYVESLTAPKAWFKANINQILDVYGRDHRLTREDIYLIIGTLEAPDYGLFVSHNNPEGQVHFNIFSPPRSGQLWGAFSIDTDASPRPQGGPSYHEDVPGTHSWANKVSTVSSSSTWDAVLLARLRFKPDHEDPTSL
ncbi:hypothetical protein BD410DRAFT_796909 [Rickenella mellea]|uniref:Protein kinase domain-containing protein n=1 Tax=Rickenella mellea TaxID=50990 RepID=A0A4Y7PHB0_9AGAM|nr:hypothetical protein BD410DRAFT_796909 [Rickenella mellea]